MPYPPDEVFRPLKFEQLGPDEYNSFSLLFLFLLPFVNGSSIINILIFQIQEITKDSATGLMTVHTLKNKQDKVALSGYDSVILAIGRGPNTDTLGLDGLVSFQSMRLITSQAYFWLLVVKNHHSCAF